MRRQRRALRPWPTNRGQFWTLLRKLTAYSAEPWFETELKDIFTGRRGMTMAHADEMAERTRIILPDHDCLLC